MDAMGTVGWFLSDRVIHYFVERFTRIGAVRYCLPAIKCSRDRVIPLMHTVDRENYTLIGKA